MKRLQLFSLFLLVTLLLSACAPAAAQPTPTSAPTDLPQPVQVARQDLAARLNLDPGQVEVVSVEEVEFPNACLGLARPGEACSEVITPGYIVTLQALGTPHLYHIDQAGQNFRAATADAIPVEEAQLRQSLAQLLGVAPDGFTIVEMVPTEWSDSCLGLGGPAESCLTVIVPGYRVIVDIGGEQRTFRTDQTGEQVREEPPQTAGEGTPAEQIARQLVAQQFGVDAAALSLVQIESVEWPDACLGAPQPGEMCAQVITPGYRVILQAGDQTYEVHTNISGSAARLALTPTTPAMENALLDWQQSGETCQVMRIAVDETVAYGPCNSEGLLGPLPTERLEQLTELVRLYAPFSAETQAGAVVFNGYGQRIPTAFEQRSLAEWSRLVFQEVSSGRSSAAAGLGLAWHREGGIAGFCDDLAVFVSGYAQANPCAGSQPDAYAPLHLNPQELEQLFTWIETLRPFEIDHTDPATADAMTIRLVFQGKGTRSASPADQDAIQAFAADLYAQSTAPASSLEEQAAEKALLAYFDLLSTRRFVEAVDLFGGSYGTLIYMNPNVAPDNFSYLLEQGCTVNGLVCLPVKDAELVDSIPPNRFLFKVEFANPDGSTFVLGPCCGASEADMPPKSVFDYTVRKIGDQFLVQELPVFVP